MKRSIVILAAAALVASVAAQPAAPAGPSLATQFRASVLPSLSPLDDRGACQYIG